MYVLIHLLLLQFHFCNYLAALEVEGIFRRSASQRVLKEIQQKYNKGDICMLFQNYICQQCIILNSILI